MLTLVLHGIFLDDLGEVIRSLLDGSHSIPLVFFSLFVFISAAMVMNMLIGILCETVRQLTSAEKENAARAQVRNKLLSLLKVYDGDGSGDITKDQLLGVITDPDVAALLQELQVDIPHLLQWQDMLYEGDGQVLSISQVMNMILDHRGDRSSTMQDVVNGHTFTRWAIGQQLDSQTASLKEYMEELLGNAAWRAHSTGQSRQVQLEAAASNKLLYSLSSWMQKS